MTKFIGLRHRLFKTDFVKIRTSCDPQVICKVSGGDCKFYITYLRDRVELGCRGRFRGVYRGYMKEWDPYICGKTLVDFYESGPEQETSEVTRTSILDDLTPGEICYIKQQYKLLEIQEEEEIIEQLEYPLIRDIQI